MVACLLLLCAGIASAQGLRGHVTVSKSSSVWTFTVFDDPGSLANIYEFDLSGLSAGTFSITGQPTGWQTEPVTASDTIATWYSSDSSTDIQAPAGSTATSLTGYVLTFTTIPTTPLTYSLLGDDGSQISGLIGGASYNWDPTHTNSTNGSGSGTWDTSSSNWYATGPSDTTFGNDGTATAVFGGAAGTYSVSVANAIHLNGLTFNTSGYTISNVTGGSLTFDYPSPTITVASGITGTISSVINASSVGTTTGIVKNGAGTLVLSNVGNAFTGGTTINAGTLSIGSDGALGAASGGITFASSGTLLVSGTFGMGTGRVIAITDPATVATINTQANTLTVGGGLSGTGTLTKIGTGTLVLTGNSTSIGDININAGMLQAGNAVGTQFLNALGSSTDAHNINVNSGTTLSLQGHDMTGAAETFNVTGATLLSNAFNRLGNVTLTGATINTGGTGPTSAAYQALSLEGNVTVSGTAASTIAPVSSGFNGIHLTGSPAGTAVTFNVGDVVAGTDLTISTPLLDQAGGSGAGALSKTGTGTLVLSGANTYTGGTQIGAGTLTEGASNVLADTGPVSVLGGIFNIGTFSDTVGAVTLQSGSITGTTGVLTGSAYGVQSGTITAILAGAGALTKTTGGTVTLSANNTYTGATNINAGTLLLSNANAITAASAVSVASGATLTFNSGASNATYNLNFPLAITGDGITTNLDFPANNTDTYNITSPITLTNGAIVHVYGLIDTVNFKGAIGGSASQYGLVFNTDGGNTAGQPHTFIFSAASTYTGNTSLVVGTQEGVLKLGIANALPATTSVNLSGGSSANSHASLDLASFSQTLAGITATPNTGGARIINSGAGTPTLTIANTGADTMAGNLGGGATGNGFSLSKTSAGTLILSGTNTYTGGTTVTGGILQLTAPTTLGAITGPLSVSTLGTLDLNGTNQTVGMLSSTDSNGFITNTATGTSILTVTGTGTFSGSIADGGSGQVVGLTQNSGTTTLTGSNAYSGGTLINAGATVAAGLSPNATVLGTGVVTLAGGKLALQGRTALTGASAGLRGDYVNKTPATTDIDTLSHLNTTFASPALANIPTTTGGRTNLDFGNFTPSTALFANQGFNSTTNMEARFSGYINLAAAGTYTFSTGSDDGSTLFIDGIATPLVNNNASQAFTTLSSTIMLAAGLHQIATGYYQGTGGDGFQVSYAGPGIASTIIPNTVLQNGGSFVTQTAQAYANNLNVTANSTVDVTGSLNATLGTLSIGAFTLGLTSADATTSPYSLTLGASTLTGNAILSVANSTGGGAGTLNLTGAIAGGANTLSKIGVGTLDLTGTGSVIGSLFAKAGTTIIDGATVTTSLFSDVGQSAGDNAILTIRNNGTFTGSGLDFNVGDASGSAGTVNISSGALSVGNLYVGKSSGGTASTTTTGAINQSGGTVTVGGAAGLTLGAASLGTGATATGTYNLGSGTPGTGTLITSKISSAGAGTTTFNFNGGTLQASAASTSFLTGLTAANVQAGGAIINTNGNGVTVGQTLRHDPALGGTIDGGLVKNGAGILTLSSAATFTVQRLSARARLKSAGRLFLSRFQMLASHSLPHWQMARMGTHLPGQTGHSPA